MDRMPRDNKGRFVEIPDKPVKLSRRVTGVRLPEEIEEILRTFPDRHEFLKEVITKAVRERVAS